MMLSSRAGGIKRGRSSNKPRTAPLSDREAEWIRMVLENNWRDAKEMTHLSLDGMLGGRFNIPEDRKAAFYAALARDIKDKRTFFLNELHTNPSGLMRVFFDLDLKGPTIKGNSFAIEFAQAAQQVVRRFFPDLPAERMDCFDVVVVSRDPDRVTAMDGTQLYTEGYHVHFPKMVQFQKDVLTIFYEMRQDCERRFHRDPIENPWKNALDPLVYDNHGLRLYGSCTIKRCVECDRRGEVSPDCVCQGSFQMNGFHRYEHILAYLRGSDGTQDETRLRQLRDNPLNVLLTCSVQVNKSLSQPSPLGFVSDPSSANVKLALSSSRATGVKAKDGWERINSANLVDTIFSLVRTFARCYEGLTLMAVFREKQNHTKYEVHVQGPGDKFCFNKIRMESGREVQGDYHKSQGIYFEITHNRIIQRCRCACEPDPASGVRRATGKRCCSTEVDIKCVLLSPEQTRTLFPNFQFDQMPLMYGLYRPSVSSAERIQKLATFVRYSAVKGWHQQPTTTTQTHAVRPPRGTVVDY